MLVCLYLYLSVYLNLTVPLGWSTGIDVYAEDHARLPTRLMVGTESLPRYSYLQWSRIWPANRSYILGDFIWTAWDYLGETAIGSSTASGGSRTAARVCRGS